jgi:deoxycytidylate deaminase
MKFPKGALELATSQAMKSIMTHKHGSVIWKGNTILGAGYNFHIAPPTTTKRRFSIHAERDCLKGLRGDMIYGANLLVVRVRRDGSLSHGGPCKGCRKLMERKGIKNCYWFDELGNVCCTQMN